MRRWGLGDGLCFASYAFVGCGNAQQGVTDPGGAGNTAGAAGNTTAGAASGTDGASAGASDGAGQAGASGGSGDAGASGAGSAGLSGAGGLMSDPCLGKVCSTPPGPTCVGSSLKSYDAIGSCVDGVCSYIEYLVACTHNGCSGNQCVPVDGCPPTSNCASSTQCKDANTLSKQTWSGQCAAGGACQYFPSQMACTYGCADGACKPSPCVGTACACVQPSAHNLLTNPGFDTNIAGWGAVSEASDTFTWVDVIDTMGACSGSGSIALTTTAPAGNSTSQFAECVNIDPASTKAYYFGAALRNGDSVGNQRCTLGECYLQWMSGANCASPEGSEPTKVQSSAIGWVTSTLGPLTRPVGASSARIACLVRSGAIGASCVFGFDQLSFTEAPDNY